MSIHNKNNFGFTLVEMLVIAPLAILLIGGLVAVIVSLTSKVMITQSRNDLAYSTNKALNQIEADVQSSTGFMSDSGNIASPQGGAPNYNSSGSFLSSNSLVLQSLATDKNPLDPNKNIIYYANQPNACGSNESLNTPFTLKLVYFVKNNSLWRRMILPTYNTNATPNSQTICQEPWQVNTCSPGYTATVCRAKDELMLDSIKSFQIKYYLTAADTSEANSGDADSATSVEIIITTEKTVVGETISNTYSIRPSLFSGR